MSTPRPKREFTSEFKADAVCMVTELAKSRAQAARELGINAWAIGSQSPPERRAKGGVLIYAHLTQHRLIRARCNARLTGSVRRTLS